MATIQQIYIALFGRPADPGGLAFWTDLTDNGADLSQLIGRLTAEPEALDRFDGLTSQEIVNLIYQSLFGREADEEGEFFVDGLESGEYTLETLAIRILDGATGSDAQVIANKEAAANLFTASLDTQEKIDAYVGIEAGQIAAQIFEGITEDPETVPTPERIEEVVEDVVAGEPGGGGEPGEPEEPEPGPGPGPGPGPAVAENEGGIVTIAAGANATVTASDDHYVITASGFDSRVFSKADVLGFDLPDSARLNIPGSAFDQKLSVQGNGVLNITGVSISQAEVGEPAHVAGFESGNLKFVIDTDFSHSPAIPQQNVPKILANGDAVEGIKLAWVYVDELYTHDIPNGSLPTNLLGIEIGKQYAAMLLEGVPAVVDFTAKASDTRDQSLHDNLLGNVGEGAISGSRYGETATDPNAREITPDQVQALKDALPQPFAHRPYEDGIPPKAVSEADVWDLLNEVSRPDLDVDPVFVIDGGTEFGWQTDRYALEDIDVDTGIITFTIDPGGPSGDDRQRYQGAKLTTEEEGDEYLDLTGDTLFTATLHIDADWVGDELGQLTGIWIQMQNDEGTIGGGGRFSIVEYLDADAVVELGIVEDGFVAGFRFWNSIDGWDHYVNFEGDGEVNLTFAFLDDAHAWFINDEIAYTYTGEVTDEVSVLETVIFNSQNFEEDQTYTYSNVGFGSIGTADTIV